MAPPAISVELGSTGLYLNSPPPFFASQSTSTSCQSVVWGKVDTIHYSDCKPRDIVWAQILEVGPYDAYSAWRDSRYAKQRLEYHYRQGTFDRAGEYNGPADAFRHCLWSAAMLISIGEDQARRVGENYEICGKQEKAAIFNPVYRMQLECEAQMDLFNNEWGRKFGNLAWLLGNGNPYMALSKAEGLCLDAIQWGILQTHSNTAETTEVLDVHHPSPQGYPILWSPF